MPASLPITIRRATREDAPQLLRLIRALADFEKLDPPTPEAEARIVEHGFETDPPKFEVWLAFVPESAEPIAYSFLFETYSSFLAKPTLYLEDLFVEESHRNRGVGRALLDHTLQLAKERSCGRVEWTALDWNVNAQRVYEDKVGAQRMKEWFLYRKTL